MGLSFPVDEVKQLDSLEMCKFYINKTERFRESLFNSNSMKMHAVYIILNIMKTISYLINVKIKFIMQHFLHLHSKEKCN